MASTVETVQIIGRSNGTVPVLLPSYSTPTATGAGNGNHFDNDKRNVFVHVKNASGGVLTLTILTNSTADGNVTLPDKTLTIANGEEPMIGPFPSSPYESTEGSVTKAISLEWSTITSVTYAVIQLPSS